MPRAFDERELLERVDNDWEFLDETVQMLSADGPALVGEIREAAGRGDAPAVGRTAHALKGMVSNFCAAPHASALEVERIGKAAGDLSSVPALLERLESELNALIADLTEFLCYEAMMRILVAEDERITRMTLARQLQAWGHEVVAAEDGQQAWEHFEAGPEFDIVLTDWEMPRVSGVEFVRRIRGAARSAYTYLIILTSRSDKADVVNGIEAGADDFVSKPFDREELRVRLLAGERVVRLERALSRQNAELRDASERIRFGLQAAARVQRSMLPRQNILTPRVRTAWKYIPTDELAGDAIGLHLIDDRYLVAYVLDVSGHGVPAALLSVSAMRTLEPEPAEASLLRDTTHADPDLGTVQRPARVASELNRRFRAGENDGRYLTMVLCVLDTHRGQLHITSAGHPPPFLLRGAEALPVPDAGGFPIAMVDGAEYEDGLVRLLPGDRLCLFSDGLIEQSRGADNEQFGAARILQSLTSHGTSAPEGLVTQVLADFGAWAGTEAFEDDVSIVVIEWLGDGNRSGRSADGL